MPPKPSKTGRQGSVEALSLDDVKSLIFESEERIMSKLDNLCSSISTLESKFDSIKTEQIRLGLEVKGIKEVILRQQEQIERLESDRRQKNLVFSGVPEGPLIVDDDTTLKNDLDKLEFLCEKIVETFDVDDIASCYRIGQKKGNRPRLLHVKFDDVRTRNSILFRQRPLRSDVECLELFGQVFINKDSTTLVRREEKRLRDRMKEIKNQSDKNDKIFIRAGKLFKNSTLVDEINIANQLF